MGLTESDYYFEDDFFSPNIDAAGTENDTWYSHGSAGGSAAIETGADSENGAVELTTNNVANSVWEIDMGTRRPILLSSGSVVAEARLRTRETTEVECGLELAEDVNNMIAIQIMNATGYANKYYTYTINGGSSTTNNGAFTMDTSYHILRIVATSSNVKFFIDGVLKETHTTDIPTDDLTPILWAETWEAAAKHCLVDYFKMRGKR